MDINTAVMTMSSFRSFPRKGHLKRLQRLYGYLAKFCESAIRSSTDEPDYSDLRIKEYDWEKSIYRYTEKIIPDDLPEPLGRPITLTTYVDVNLYHGILTGRFIFVFFTSCKQNIF